MYLINKYLQNGLQYTFTCAAIFNSHIFVQLIYRTADKGRKQLPVAEPHPAAD